MAILQYWTRGFAAAAIAALALSAHADYPERPIRLVNPFAAGVGAMDIAARTMAEKMAARLGSPVVVANQPGAGGTLVGAAVARGAKDGYSIYFGTSSGLVFAKLLNRDFPYDPVRDFAPVALLGSVPIALFVSASSDIHSLQDLIAAARARPGALNFGSPGVGTVTHVAVEMLMERAGIRMNHVPYGGSLNYWSDLVGGQLDVVSGGLTGGVPLVKDGRLRLIATATATRTKTTPDVPAIGEVIPGYDAPAWVGLVVAQGTPEPIVAKLESTALEALSDSGVGGVLGRAGIEVTPMGRKEFGAKIRNDLALWERTLKNSGLIKP